MHRPTLQLQPQLQLRLGPPHVSDGKGGARAPRVRRQPRAPRAHCEPSATAAPHRRWRWRRARRPHACCATAAAAAARVRPATSAPTSGGSPSSVRFLAISPVAASGPATAAATGAPLASAAVRGASLHVPRAHRPLRVSRVAASSPAPCALRHTGHRAASVCNTRTTNDLLFDSSEPVHRSVIN